MIESQYNISDPPRVQYWYLSSQLIKKITLPSRGSICTVSLCSVLLLWQITLPLKAVWVCRNSNSLFPFEELYPDVALLENLKRLNTFASCQACRNPLRKRCYRICPIPSQIQAVRTPWEKKYLSLIFFHSSLGRTGNLSQFSEYRSIRGTMNYSKNYWALYLYLSCEYTYILL